MPQIHSHAAKFESWLEREIQQPLSILLASPRALG